MGTSAGSNAKKQSDIPSRKSGNASLSDMDDVIALTDNDVVFADKFKMVNDCHFSFLCLVFLCEL